MLKLVEQQKKKFVDQVDTIKY